MYFCGDSQHKTDLTVGLWCELFDDVREVEEPEEDADGN